MNLTRNSIVAGLAVLSVAAGASPAMAQGGDSGGSGTEQAAGTTSFYIAPDTTTTTTTTTSGGTGGHNKPIKCSGGICWPTA